MRIAYLDCFSGISGDMTVGAFLDAGLKLSVIKKGLRRLDIVGYEIGSRKIQRNGIWGTKFDVKITHKNGHKGITYRQIKQIINRSSLNTAIKNCSLMIFEKLAAAESKIHNIKKEKVHFHEIGGLDSIIDCVSTAIAINETQIQKFFCLNLRLGRGFVKTAHGLLPVPPPAVLELLKGKRVVFSDCDHELITPTGASIVTTLVKDFDSAPGLKTESIGYGAGMSELKQTPNFFRLIIGERVEQPIASDEIMVCETNVDDMSPVSYDYLVEKLFAAGALDVYLTSVYMKKTRPGVLITVLSKENLLDELSTLIMKETTTSGIRFYKSQRKILNRFSRTVRTRYGPIRVKVNTGPKGIETIAPEYEDCKKAAMNINMPFKVVFDEAKAMASGIKKA